MNGKMPTQAKANGLKLDPVPTELSDLNSLELRLISMRIPFMKMVALPRGQQRSIHGPAVNIPSNLTAICHLLPRLPSETQLIPMKLKRKLTYKGHYMYQYVSSEKLMNAVRWLKIHNSIYSNTVINEEWSKQSAVDDATLFDALTNKSFENNSSSNDMSSRLCSTSFFDSVAISSDIVSELHARVIHGYRMLTVLASQRGFSIQDVPADGDCLFSAISLQLESVGIQPAESKELRHELVKYMDQNPPINEDLYYISELQSNDDILNADTDVPNDEDNQISLIEDPHTQAEIRWIKYLQRLREGAWGDQVLASMLNVNIKIISTLNPNMPLVKPLNCTSNYKIYLGLIDQFHYVALVKKSSMNTENNKHDILNTEDKDLEEKERAEDEAAFEHEYQIKGALFETTLTPENPELGEKIYSVAPGEGQKPIPILTDIKFEEMCNPDKYPFGQGGIHKRNHIT